jgi:5-(carboxyamino)imidazole ribonucleotide synthase
VSSGLNTPLRPGATIGVLGSGQLGRMFAIAARQMGYRVHTFSPDTDTPAGQVADKEWIAPYTDVEALTAFAREVDVATFEFENIPSASVNVIAGHVAVRPSGAVLHVAQNRLREKTFLKEHGFPIAPFAPVRSLETLRAALATIGVPAVLKTAGFGYDGKGQKKITSLDEAETAWAGFEGSDAVLEGFVNFKCEASVVAARGVDGSFAHFGLFENAHKNHILDVTVSPAKLSPAIQRRAITLTQKIMHSLDVVGLMCVELFITKKGEPIVNELAPRPHNSGHLTIDAFETSQFEQQVRAVCGLPLGSTRQLKPAAMVNLLGDVWERGEPKWENALKDSSVKLHLYGKSEPRAGRKMGHLTALASTVDAARRAALNARERLKRR